MTTSVTRSQASQLLHNKFVVFLGGSVQRSMYKDLVLLLRKDQYLTLPQLKSKGELSFECDSLVEGGRLGPMSNGTKYREVRQYSTDHHLLRFYFITRVYSPYMESILEDFRRGLKPDLVIVSSCVWDVTRYGLDSLQQYKENLHCFFGQIKTVCHDCLVLWTLAMPIAKKIKGGFLVPEVSHLGPSLCDDIIEANFYCSRLADVYGLDVLDLHFHFRLSLQHRMPDGVHWDARAHRRITSLLLQHTAEAWGVELHKPSAPGPAFQDYRGRFRRHRSEPRPQMDIALQRRSLGQYHHRRRRFHGVPPNLGFPLPTRDPWALHFHRQRAMHGAGCNWYYYGRVGQPHFPFPVGRPPPPPPRPPPPPPRRDLPAARSRPFLRRYSNPLPRSSHWPGQHVNLQAICSHMHSRWRAGFGVRPGEHCMRRRRPNIRTHPYPCVPPWVIPRHPAYGW